MKKIIPVVLLLLLGTLSLRAQGPHSIKGFVVDTLYTTRLINSSVSVLNAKDSTLVKFTRVGENGAFNIPGIPTGKFILLVTYPGYADYVEKFNLDSLHKEKDFGKVNLILMAKLLSEVLIKGTAGAIKIKGDTTEFNASGFTIQPNSKVEDLLKQLPGIQVDKDGKITAQGQKVNKVLVDGEEFFGDDPTLVTKNIRGDMVDKVQLYDKKSDQATFTGIDDGVKEKTLNIKLKEDKKQGYFGKLDAGAGTNKNYEGQGMFNMFKGKKKFSAYGTIGNTGRTGLGWQDNSKYGSSSNMEFSDDGGIMIFGGGGDDLESFSGQYNGEGIPLARTGGVHYDGKWNQDKESINSNYKIGSLSVDGTKNVQTQNNLPGGIIKSNSDQTFNNYAFRQKLDGIYEIKLDSTSSLKVSVEGTLKNNETNTHYSGNSLRENDVLLNTTDRNLDNKTDEKLFKATAFWNKKLKKKGRSISLSLSESINEKESKGFLRSENGFYNTSGKLDSTRIVDQYKTNRIRSSVFNSNLTYSEPFSPYFSVILNYGLGINNGLQDRKSFNAVSPGQYTVLDSAFSNNYKLDQLSNQVGAIFNYKKEKTIINFGTKMTAVNFEQLDQFTNKKMDRNFLNWSPQASYQYKFSQQKSIRISYNGNNTQPSIDQIQPVRVNTDPLNITVGNPDLKPSFTNRFNASYNSYKVLSSRYLWLNASYSFTMNPIVSNTTTDAASGKTTYQSINLTTKNTSNYYLYGSISSKIKAIGIDAGLFLNANGNTFYNYVNSELNKTESYTYSGGFNVSRYAEKKYNFYVSFGPNYNTGQSSLQKNVNNNGWGFTANSSATVYLPAKFEISSDVGYEYRGKTESFNEDFKRTIWNASLSKKFFKSEELKLSLSGRDLLNQNTGFNRSAYGNMLTQTNFTTIKRYFMCSLTWDFNKMGGGAKTQK
ncbi:TonB-dependent receptor [Pedobacter nutrimenti]|uniref:Carboxypeptidase family protein n=1 Tax=Pedobacter nutrimenti TaxID=1241337 RepID=A0A318U6D9_9SPHI|nr:TonB-dependent receptor [Pedobacter nutrimenti]PYF68873.1 carboxypeptidase family protein [Pedobacter nutrimenti]